MNAIILGLVGYFAAIEHAQMEYEESTFWDYITDVNNMRDAGMLTLQVFLSS